jgi:hypothetical protein
MDEAKRMEWMAAVCNEWDGPLTRTEVDALWQEVATGYGPMNIGDFGDTPIIDLLLTIERGVQP